MGARPSAHAVIGSSDWKASDERGCVASAYQSRITELKDC
jgi:hypothetical protein